MHPGLEVAYHLEADIKTLQASLILQAMTSYMQTYSLANTNLQI